MKKAELIRDLRAELGEGSLWHPKDNQLWLVDIEGHRFFIYDPTHDQLEEYDTKQRIGTVVPSITGSAVVALQDGIYELDLQSKQQKLLAPHEASVHEIRFNDGKCDPSGRLWVGSMHIEGLAHQGGLYRLDERGLTLMTSGITISNGICWSADKQSMYYIDSPRQQVSVYDFDAAAGEIANERVAFPVDRSLGTPDGMTIDAEGMLWVALWGGAAVGRWDPHTGELLEKVEVPALNVTSCAFGGEDLSTLYITTASVEMSEEQRSQYPLAGGLFAVNLEVRGVPAYLFG